MNHLKTIARIQNLFFARMEGFNLSCHKNGSQNLMHKAKKSDIINRDKCIGILKRDKERINKNEQTI